MRPQKSGHELIFTLPCKQTGSRLRDLQFGQADCARSRLIL